MRKLSPALLLLALTLLAAPALAQPSVTVNGPSSVTIVDTCENVTWTCSPSGGVTPYTWYLWTLNGSTVALGSSVTSFTQRFCENEGDPPHSFNVTVACTVDDSNGRSGTGSKVTTINFV